MSLLLIGQALVLAVGITALFIAFAQHEEIRQWEHHRLRVPPGAVRLRRRSLQVALGAFLLAPVFLLL